jgi:hypothetical protein
MHGTRRILLSAALLILVARCGATDGDGSAPLPPLDPPDAKAWRPAAPLAEEGLSPSVEVDADGEFLAVWTQAGPSALGPYSLESRRLAASGWAEPQAFTSPQSDLVAARLATDQHGQALAVWTDQQGVWASRQEPGRGWLAPQSVAAAPLVGLFFDAAWDGQGHAHVLWLVGESGRALVRARRFSAETGWEAPVELREAGSVGPPSLAVNERGDAVAAWSEFTLAASDVLACRYTPGKGWGESVLVGRFSTEHPTAKIGLATTRVHVTNPRVAIDREGTAIVAWGEDALPEAGATLRARRSSSSGDWEPEQILVELESKGEARPGDLKFDARGNATLVWAQFADAGIRDGSLWADRFEPGRGWGVPVQLQDEGLGDGPPDLGVSPGGSAVVAWAQLDGPGRLSFWAARWVPGGGWSAPALLQAVGPELKADWTFGEPKVAVALGGRAAAVWSWPDRQRYRLWASHLE